MAKDFFVTWTRQSDAQTLEVVRAHEDEFELRNGARVFDMLSTSFQTSFGHSQKRITDRIAHQLVTMPIASPKAVFGLKERVSQRLLDLLQLGGGKLFYTVSGAESVENALKIARQFTGRPCILARRRSYHGATLGAMSVSGDWRSRDHLTFAEGTIRIPEPNDDPEARQTQKIVEQTGKDRIAALIVEPVSGVNGVVIPPASWWTGIQSLCRENGILLVCDEVLNGFGRTGPHFAFQDFDAKPDLVTLSKAMTGGYIPFGAVWVNPDIARYYDKATLACGLTSYAHPLGLAATDGVIDLLTDPEVQQHKQNLERQFGEWTVNLRQQPGITAIRQKGLLCAVELNRPAPTWQQMIEQGIYAFSKENLLVLAPPLTANAQRFRSALERLWQLIIPAAVVGSSQPE